MRRNYKLTASQKYWFPIILLAYEVAVYLSNDMYLPALPEIAKQLNASADQVQKTMTAWFFGSCSVTLFLSPVVDYIGRKRVLVGGCGLFVLSCIACALAYDINFMIAVRFIQGMCVCVVFVAGYTCIHEWYSGKKAIQILAWMGSITILAPSVGTYLGAWIVHIFSWQMTFWMLTIWGLLCFIALIYFMPSIPKQESFAFRVALHSYRVILTTPAFIKFTATAFCCFIPLFAWLVDGPFIVMQTYHQTPLFFGLMQATIFAGYMVGMRFTKRFIRKWHVKKVLRFGFLVVAASAMLFMCCGWFDFGLEVAVASFTGISLGTAIVSGPLNRLAVESSAEPTVQKVAIYSNAIGFAAVVASFLVVLTCARHMLISLAWISLMAIALGITCFRLLPGKVELNDEGPDVLNAPEI
jgi:predicted MFS family arabinose efflux permease